MSATLNNQSNILKEQYERKVQKMANIPPWKRGGGEPKNPNWQTRSGGGKKPPWMKRNTPDAPDAMGDARKNVAAKRLAAIKAGTKGK